MASDSETLSSTSESPTTTSGSLTTSETAPSGTTTMGDTTPTTTTAGGGTSYCIDADMDGFGDPTMCTNVPDGDTPPDGTVPNDPDDPADDDCDDSNKNTHPGAAEIDSDTLYQQDNDDDGYGDNTPPPAVDPGSDCDDNNVNTHPGIDPNNPDACQQDNDMDGQGDSDPPQGVDPGADCDDDDPNTFVGAAETENPAACMKDEDGDGWGDTSVPGGVDVGSDCYDMRPSLNPDIMVLMSMFNGASGDVQRVNLETGEVTTFANVNTEGLPSWSVPSSTLDPVSEMIFVANASDFRLYAVDYCSDAPPVALNLHGYSLCGITFTPEGRLFGASSETDILIEFDPDTGDALSTTPVTSEGNALNFATCGMTYDCELGKVLMSGFFTKKVYSVDPETGEAVVMADVPDAQFGRSLAYDPVTKNVHSSNGLSSVTIELDGSNSYVQNADLMSSIDDLEFGPSCD